MPGPRFSYSEGNPLLTAGDVAARLNVSLRSLYHLRHRGILPPAVKWGNTLRWRKSDIEQWLEGHLDDGTR